MINLNLSDLQEETLLSLLDDIYLCSSIKNQSTLISCFLSFDDVSFKILSNIRNKLIDNEKTF